MKRIYVTLVAVMALAFASFGQESAAEFTNAGNAAYKAKDYAKAYDNFSKSFELEETKKMAFFAGYCAYKSNSNDEAIKYLSKSIELGYKASTCYFTISSIYKSQDENTKYEETLKAGLDADPNRVGKYGRKMEMSLANLYYNQGANFYKKGADKLGTDVEAAKVAFKEALPFMEKAHDVNPKLKESLIALAEIYKVLENTEKEAEIKAQLGN